MSKRAVLYRMVTPDHICPFGLKSKELLERKVYDVEDHHLSNRSETDAFKEKHNVKTTPQTFIDDKRIGGYDDLRDYFNLKQESEFGSRYTPIIVIFFFSRPCGICAHAKRWTPDRY